MVNKVHDNESTTDMANIADCKWCGQSLAWLTARSGKKYPVEYDGEIKEGRAVVVRNAFHDCPIRQKPCATPKRDVDK